MRKIIIRGVVFFTLFCGTAPAAGQNPDDAGATETRNASVQSVVNQKGKPYFGLGDRVVVTVDDIGALLDRKPREEDRPLLFLDRIPMHGAKLLSIDSINRQLRYELAYDSIFADCWKRFYRLGHNRVKVMATVGYEGAQSCILSSEIPVRLVMYQRPVAILAFVILLAAIAAFVVMARKTAIIRDGIAGSSYSLGKTQLAWWSFILIGSYVLIGIVTGVLPKLSTEIIALLGISMGTTAGAKALDRVGKKDGIVAVDSSGFLYDLLSDDAGINIHRFQMFLWTLVFGVFFVWKSLSKLELLSIDEGQLMLMGISSATYLGLRTAESSGGSDGMEQGVPVEPPADTPSADISTDETAQASDSKG